MGEPLSPGPRSRAGLAAVLAVSAALRLWIVARGGQYFWPDEARYDLARQAAARLAAGEWSAAWNGLFARPEHLLFKVAALLPAAAQRLAGTSDPRLPAAFFAAFSVLSIAWVFRLARRCGAGEGGALAAAALAAGSSGLFYYSRHLLPYDLALFLGLCAWDCALEPRSARRAFAAGGWAGLCFLAYNGYWLLGGAALVACACAGGLAFPRRLRLGLAALAGVALPLLAVVAIGARLGHDVPRELAAFSESVVNDDLGRAWRVLPAYFWSAERLNALLLAAALAWCALRLARRRPIPGGAGALAACLALLAADLALSDALRRFTVHGRYVRIALPFACVCGGAVLADAWRRGGRRRGLAVAALALYFAQAGANFAPPLAQWFPPRFQAEAARRAALLRAKAPGSYRAAQASFIFDSDEILPADLPGRALWRKPHPQQFEPYLFEGPDSAERARFRLRPIWMSLVRLEASGRRGWLGSDPALSRLGGYPGRVELTLRLNLSGLGRFEPLIQTGETGRGDLLWIAYQDAAHIKLGLDHWGLSGSEPVTLPFDFARAHRLTVGMGSLYPPGSPPSRAARLFLALDGRTFVDVPQEFHPAAPDSVVFGLNLAGEPAAGAVFTGTIEEVRPVEP